MANTVAIFVIIIKIALNKPSDVVNNMTANNESDVGGMRPVMTLQKGGPGARKVRGSTI